MALFLLALLLAVQTPTPTLTPSPTPAPAVQSPRLALIIDRAIRPVTQPSFDRWVNDAAARFATRFSVTTVPVPPDDPQPFADPRFCASSHVVGALIPERHWHISSTTATVTVWYVIFDCDGDRFYDDSATLTEKRNHAMIPQAQIESIASHATDMLLAKFATFISGHQVLWSRLLATGSLRDLSSVKK